MLLRPAAVRLTRVTTVALARLLGGGDLWWRQIHWWMDESGLGLELVATVTPLVQCGTGLHESIWTRSGQRGPGLPLLLHPVGYRFPAVEVVPSRVLVFR